MAIKADKGPAHGPARVGAAFSAMTEGPADLFSTEAGGAASARVRLPIPIFAIDLEQLRDTGADALRGARRTGWRYLVEHGERVDVVDLPIGDRGQPKMLGGGELGGRLVRSGRKAERLAESGPDFEPRILDLNLIGNSVLWLHNPDRPESDRFVSLSEGARELKADALISRIRNAAGRKLINMDGGGGEAGG